MRAIIPAAVCLAVSATPAFAMNNPVSQTTAVGIGAAKSTSISNSNSAATAIGGGNATGGNATANGGNARSNATGGAGGTGVGVGTGGTGGNVTIQGTPAQTSQTITQQGHSSVSNVPSVFAPGLAAAGIESCLGSVSGGGSWLGTGITLGGSIPDSGCNARLSARTLWAFGLHAAAISLLCQQADIYNAMPQVCVQYMPRVATAPAYYPTAAPAVIPASFYYDDLKSYHGGSIMLVDGKSGQERLCTNYDVSRRHCRAWEGTVNPKPKQVSRPVKGKQVSAVSPPLPEPRPVHQVARLTESLGQPLWIQMIHPETKAVIPPTVEKKESSDDESLSRCIGFCAAPGGVKR